MLNFTFEKIVIMKKNLFKLIIGFGLIVSIIGCENSESTKLQKMNTPEVPLQDFFKNSESSSYQISPNGDYMAFMAPYKSRMNVFVQKIGSDEKTRITSVTERDISGYMWANNNRILFIKDNDGDENFALFGVDIDGESYQELTAFDGVMTRLLDELEGIDDYILVALNKRSPQIFDPYRLNINTGQLEILFENPGNISSWMTDHEGKLRIAITTDGVNTSLLHRVDENSEFKTVITTNFKESLSPQLFTFDNKNLYATSNIGRDKSVAVVFDLETGKETKILFEHPEVDVSYIAYSNKRKVLTAISYTTDKRYRKYLDDETKNMMESIESKLLGYEVGIGSANKAEDKYIVRSYSDKTRGSYYFYDKANNQLDKLVDISPWLDENQMTEMTPIKYQSRDGLTINGYLTLPKGTEAKNLPVVLNVHGGPWARDNWGFNPEVQFLANRGFAVLQMNFRGSTGYGKSFWEASFKQWGQNMQNDVTDGAQWLIDQEIADPTRIAIYGASYGGYATLAGLCYTPDLYACGVDYVGVSNLFSFMNTIPPYWEQYLGMMYEMVGHPKSDSSMMAAFSPALNADKITSPLFIAQGAKDPRVNKAESDQMVEALKAKGTSVQYLVKENEGHGFRNEENKFEFHESMIEFLNTHIGDKTTK
tara:strand:+ start:6536 stop:8491 length:1956 start_codon:yes stop_codon:yes gene_type:complete